MSIFDDLPLTPAEHKLYELEKLKEQLKRDNAEQEGSRRFLDQIKQCGAECWYPDVCSAKASVRGDIPKEHYPCVLYQLSVRVESPWWKKVFLGEPYEESADSAKVLSRIRQSQYYDPVQEELLDYFRTKMSVAEIRHYFANKLRYGNRRSR